MGSGKDITDEERSAILALAGANKSEREIARWVKRSKQPYIKQLSSLRHVEAPQEPEGCLILLQLPYELYFAMNPTAITPPGSSATCLSDEQCQPRV